MDTRRDDGNVASGTGPDDRKYRRVRASTESESGRSGPGFDGASVRRTQFGVLQPKNGWTRIEGGHGPHRPRPSRSRQSQGDAMQLKSCREDEPTVGSRRVCRIFPAAPPQLWARAGRRGKCWSGAGRSAQRSVRCAPAGGRKEKFARELDSGVIIEGGKSHEFVV